MEPSRGTIRLRIDKYLDGETIAYGVPVRFTPLLRRKVKGLSHRNRRRKHVDVVSPVSSEPQRTVPVQLPPGRYAVEATLPSGEMLATEIDAVAGESRDLVLRGDPSPNEWRSWSHFAGASLASDKRVTRERAIRRGLIPGERQVQLRARIGSKFHCELPIDSFDPRSWCDWYLLLEYRHMNRMRPRHRLWATLDPAPNGLDLHQEGGQPGEPIRFTMVDNHTEWTPPEEVGSRRLFLVLDGRTGDRIITLPWPWLSDEPATKMFEVVATETDDGLRAEPSLIDQRWGGLLAYVNSGRVTLAARILDQASRALFEKFNNPLAAAVGGYILLSTGQENARPRWPRWIRNLSVCFPHVPDGCIQRAKYLLDRGREDDLPLARRLVMEATRRGIPFFTIGVAWLIECLQRLAIDDEAMELTLAQVRTVARVVDFGQLFTSFDLPAQRDGRGAASALEMDRLSAVSITNTGSFAGDVSIIRQIDEARSSGVVELDSLGDGQIPARHLVIRT